MLTLFNGADNLIRLDALKLVSTDAYQNSATVTMTLKDPDGASVSGATGLTLAYVAASNGRYEGTIPYSVELTNTTPDAPYSLELTTVSGSVHDFRKIICWVVDRAET